MKRNNSDDEEPSSTTATVVATVTVDGDTKKPKPEANTAETKSDTVTSTQPSDGEDILTRGIRRRRFVVSSLSRTGSDSDTSSSDLDDSSDEWTTPTKRRSTNLFKSPILKLNTRSPRKKAPSESKNATTSCVGSDNNNIADSSVKPKKRKYVRRKPKIQNTGADSSDQCSPVKQKRKRKQSSKVAENDDAIMIIESTGIANELHPIGESTSGSTIVEPTTNNNAKQRHLSNRTPCKSSSTIVKPAISTTAATSNCNSDPIIVKSVVDTELDKYNSSAIAMEELQRRSSITMIKIDRPKSISKTTTPTELPSVLINNKNITITPVTAPSVVTTKHSVIATTSSTTRNSGAQRSVEAEIKFDNSRRSYVVNLANGHCIVLTDEQISELRNSHNGRVPSSLKIPLPPDVAEIVETIVIDD